MEKEKVLEIEFLKVWDKWAWAVIKCNLQMKDNEFFKENDTKLIMQVRRNSDEYIIFLEDNVKGIGEFNLVTDEEKESIENFVDLINEKYGIPKRWRAEYKDKYFAILNSGKILEIIDYGDIDDNIRYNLGNYFKTKEEAEKVKAELDKFWAKVRAGEIGND